MHHIWLCSSQWLVDPSFLSVEEIVFVLCAHFCIAAERENIVLCRGKTMMMSLKGDRGRGACGLLQCYMDAATAVVVSPGTAAGGWDEQSRTIRVALLTL